MPGRARGDDEAAVDAAGVDVVCGNYQRKMKKIGLCFIMTKGGEKYAYIKL